MGDASSVSTVLFTCEVNPEYSYHCRALRSHFPGAATWSLPDRKRLPPLDGVDVAVISGSTAAVYEDRSWLATARGLVRQLVDRQIPTLGVCFGHQLVNDALGGRVESVTPRAQLVAVDFDDVPLFARVSPVVPALHGDVVTTTGGGMRSIASVRDYDYPRFATRHDTAPLWTVQFHPELTESHRERLVADFAWTDSNHSFDSVTGHRLLANFRILASGLAPDGTAPPPR